MDWRKYVTAAHGYLDLGMAQDAWAELEEMPARDRARAEVVVMRLHILQAMGRWGFGAEIARGAVEAYPDCPELYLLGAYHVRRAEDVKAALDFLRSGGGCMEGEPAYWFNVGCYRCQLGDTEEAKRCVRKACELDRSFQKLALEDDDLEPLWQELGRG